VVRIKERIASVIAREAQKLLEVVLKDIDKDGWMSALEAVDDGLVHRIIERQSDLK
jgi:ATP-dependent protease ClpP protease subunit